MTRLRSTILYLTRADLLCPGLLFLLPFAFFWRETLGWSGLGDQDAVFWFFPIYHFFAQTVRNGELPLWYPDHYSGVPIFARWQGGGLDPFNWLHLAGPTSGTLTLSLLLGFAVAMVSMWWYARLIGLARRAGVVAAIIYSLSGFLVARTLYPVFVHVVALAPLILALMEKLYRDGRWREVGLGSLVVAWQVFAGHPQPLIYSSLLVVAYALFRLSSRGGAWRGSLPCLVRFVGVYVLGAGLAAIQLLPAAEAADRSVRRDWTYEMFTLHSINPASLLTALIPFFQGGGQGIYRMPYWGISWHHNEEQLYLGVLALALAAGGAALAIHRRHGIGLFWTGAVLVGVLLTLGKYIEPLARIVYHLPVLGQFRGSNRHWLVVVMGVAVLAGIAVDHLLRQPLDINGYLTRVIRLIAAILTAIVAICGLLILRLPAIAETLLRSMPDWGDLSPGFLAQARLEMLVPLGVGVLVTATLWLWTGSRWRGRWYLPVLSLLLIDYYLYAANAPIRHVPDLESRVGQALPPPVNGGSFNDRYARTHILLTPSDGEFSPLWFAGHRMVTGYDPLVDRRYREFTGINEAGHSWLRTIVLWRDRTLDLLSTRYLILPPDWRPEEASSVTPIELASERSVSGYARADLGDTVTVEAQPGPKAQAGLRLACGELEILTAELPNDRPNVVFGPLPEISRCQGVIELTVVNHASHPLTISGMWITDSRSGLRHAFLGEGGSCSPDPRRWREVGHPNPRSPYAEYRLFENLRSLPPAWLVTEVEEAWEGDQLKLLRGEIRDRHGEHFDPRTTVLVDMPRPYDEPERQWYRQPGYQKVPPGNSPGEARIADLRADRLTIEVNAAHPAILVVSEVADPDWRVTIDGHHAEWHRVDYVLRGLPVPAGQHIVEFRYRPAKVALGALCSAVSALLIAPAIVLGSRRRRSIRDEVV